MYPSLAQLARPLGPFEVAAVIPARGGSKGVPRKALADLGGEPLLVHTIRAALAARKVRTVVVSTDDAEIAEVARAAGALVPALRPTNLAGDAASLEGALLWTLDTIRERLGRRVDILVNLMPTYPFRDPAWIDDGVERLIRSRGDTVSTWTRLRGRPEEWLESLDGALYPVLHGPIRDAIATERVEVFRASGSMNVEWRNPRSERTGWVRGGWVGAKIRGAASIDVDEPAHLIAARAVVAGRERSPYDAPPSRDVLPRVPVAVAIPDPALLCDDPPSGDWRAWGRHLAALLGDPRPLVLERESSADSRPRMRGLFGCAAALTRHRDWRAGARVRVVVDTRRPSLDVAALAVALDALARGDRRLALGVERVDDHPLLCLVEAAGEGTLLLDRMGLRSFRRQDFKPAFEPAGFVAWRPSQPLPNLAAGEPIALDAVARTVVDTALDAAPSCAESLASRVVHDALERLEPDYVAIELDHALDVERCLEAA